VSGTGAIAEIGQSTTELILDGTEDLDVLGEFSGV
jgi:hypothetical protein